MRGHDINRLYRYGWNGLSVYDAVVQIANGLVVKIYIIYRKEQKGLGVPNAVSQKGWRKNFFFIGHILLFSSNRDYFETTLL